MSKKVPTHRQAECHPSAKSEALWSGQRKVSVCLHYLVLTKERHDGGAGVVGVLPGHEGGHHEPGQQRLELSRAS